MLASKASFKSWRKTPAFRRCQTGPKNEVAIGSDSDILDPNIARELPQLTQGDSSARAGQGQQQSKVEL
jgi:hypothetical protein